MGREAERQALRDAVQATAGGASTIVEVAGEAGIGKSRLLRYAEDIASRRGLTVIAGRASEIEQDLPYGVWLDALDALPSAAESTDGGSPQLRHLLHRQVRAQLVDLAGPKGLLITLDDLHWADPASVDLLRSIVDRGVGAPATILLAHRPRQRGSTIDLARWVGERGSYVALELQPFTASELAPLLAEQLSREERARMTQACGGNPLFLAALLRSDHGVGEASASQNARAVLASELEPLSAGARRLLDAAAVVGDPFSVAHAAALAELDLEHAAALEELVAADLLRPADAPGTFAFRHALVHAEIYRASSDGWRSAAHRRVASMLQDEGARPWALAPHVERSAVVGDLDAVAALAAAGRAMASRAPVSAARWLSSAYRLLPPAARTEIDGLVLAYDVTSALVVADRTEEAYALLVDLLDRVDAEHFVWPTLSVGAAMIERITGRHGAARQRLVATLAQLPDGPSAQRCAVLVELAGLELASGNLVALAPRLDDALDGARHLDDPVLLAGAQAASALAGCLQPHPAGATAAGDAVDTLTAMLAALPAAAVGSAARALLMMAEAASLMRRPAAALEVLEAAMPGTVSGALPIQSVELLGAHARLLAEGGQLGRAAETADAALEEARLMGSGVALMSAHLAVAVTEEITGDARTASLAAEQALLYAVRAGLTAAVEPIRLVQARALLAAGDGLEAQQALETCGAKLPPTLQVERGHLLVCALAAGPWVAGDAPDVERLDRVVAQTHEAAEVDALDASWAFAWAASAERSLAIGTLDTAVDEASDAAARADAAGLPMVVLRMQLLQGRALAAAGRRDEAAVVLRTVEARCTAVGAHRLAAEAVRALRGIGRRVNRAGRGGVRPGGAGLSPRQREVAELVALGLSNREVADRLHLSAKTVETHLAGAFVALGVGSRTALATALRDVGESSGDRPAPVAAERRSGRV